MVECSRGYATGIRNPKSMEYPNHSIRANLANRQTASIFRVAGSLSGQYGRNIRQRKIKLILFSGEDHRTIIFKDKSVVLALSQQIQK